MGLLHSSSPIVTDGLVYALDAGNTKSYPGRPTSKTNSPWFDLIGSNLNDESIYGPRLIDLTQTNWSYADGAITLSGELALNSPVVSHTSAWTWECWVRFNSWGAASSGYLFRANSSGNGEAFFVDQSTIFNNALQGRPFMQRNDGSGSSGANSNLMPDPIALGDWSHLVCTGTIGSTYFMYYNGNNVGSYASSSTFEPSQMSKIGGPLTDLSFGQVRVYDRELSALEVEQNFNAHRARYGL